MERIPVLFRQTENKNPDGFACSSVFLTVTSKDYFDRKHALSDGSDCDPYYEAIQTALESIGYGELSESIYEPPATSPLSDKTLITRMAAMGFDFIPFNFNAILPH